MKECKGYPLPLGVSEKNQIVNFSMAVESGKKCSLCIYKRGQKECMAEIPMLEETAVGEVRFLAFLKSDMKNKEYVFRIDGEYVLDPYVKSIVRYEDMLRGKVLLEEYDWEGDTTLNLPYHEVVAYNLHVRGYTRNRTSKVTKKGTFSGLVEKIPYMKDLGINQIQCMPIYEFEESKQYTNYWGYGEAYCFAVKEKYAATKSPEKELKDMVKACHKEGIEVVLHLPFTEKTPKQLIVECLRYYVMEYHIDGFILNPYIAPMSSISTDPLLKKTKILHNQDDFQTVMRCFLKGDEDQVQGVMWWIRQLTGSVGSCNYITNHTGFTLADLVSYERKHNEKNGEDNQDGPDKNDSWNCGVEGPTRKQNILKLRKKQMRNAMFLLLMAQGTPSILAGDEFGNSQSGNNNVYCQDNETAWIDWKQLEKQKEFVQYVKNLIQLRRKFPVLHPKKPLLGIDKTSCGVPDISFHGENAWQIPNHRTSRELGVYYHGIEGEDCFIAYNMHWESHSFALPALSKKKKWYMIFSTGQELGIQETKLLENQKEIMVEGRTIMMFEGRE